MSDGTREVQGAARLELVPGVHLLHPEDAVLDAMMSSWARQQIGGRGLQAGTAAGRQRIVEQFRDFTNEYPWNWTAAHIDEWMADLVMQHDRAKSTLRTYQGAVSLFWTTCSTRSTGGRTSAWNGSARTRRRSSTTATVANTSWITRARQSAGR